MPISQREAMGSAPRGVCPKCQAITKRKDPLGRWVSKCAHPGERYETMLLPAGKKTAPNIPKDIDLGEVHGQVKEARARAQPTHKTASAPLSRTTREYVQGVKRLVTDMATELDAALKRVTAYEATIARLEEEAAVLRRDVKLREPPQFDLSGFYEVVGDAEPEEQCRICGKIGGPGVHGDDCPVDDLEREFAAAYGAPPDEDEGDDW